MTNPILRELHEVRRQILAEHGDDLHDYLRAELGKTKASGHPIAKIKQRSVRCAGAAKSSELAMEEQRSPPRDP